MMDGWRFISASELPRLQWNEGCEMTNEWRFILSDEIFEIGIRYGREYYIYPLDDGGPYARDDIITALRNALSTMERLPRKGDRVRVLGYWDRTASGKWIAVDQTGIVLDSDKNAPHPIVIETDDGKVRAYDPGEVEVLPPPET